MERLSFTSPEALDVYCDRLRVDLSSRGDEQRRLIETALERLDLLAAQAAAVRSDALASEIAARREEGLQMLAQLGATSEANPGTQPPPFPTPSSPYTRLDDAGQQSIPLVTPVDINSEGAPESSVTALDPVIAPEALFASPIAEDTSKIEALWQQPVDPRSAPESIDSEGLETLSQAWPENPATMKPVAPSPEPEPEEAMPVFAQSIAPLAVSGVSVASQASFEPPAEAELDRVPVPAPAPDLPPTMNWAWGAPDESPVWAALLVEDAPVPVKPLTDSDFMHTPPASEVEAESPVIPLAGMDGATALQQLVLNVKVGEWGSAHPLSKPELLVGRRDLGTRCMPDVEVMYDTAVSRRHLRILRDNGSYVVEDLNSTNGTTLNGHSLRPGEPEQLKAGDELEIGEFTLLRIASA